MKIAVYPGSFDPITNGHLDVLQRAAELFDQVIVGVLQNPDKKPLFSVDERIHMIREATVNYPRVVVDSFMGLLVDYMKLREAVAIVRGLREISDFENELRMAHMNRQLYVHAVTVFIPTNTSYSYLSSSLVKELAMHGADISHFVPEVIEQALHAKFFGV
ncbi:pantetheine-phosphate adenylyltransferase [Alicyclobacillaceae bacterium I2511]|nr:pantetheine-phosphate adenylyltransferase [Alicyclobacillaceae bacterium I2511]